MILPIAPDLGLLLVRTDYSDDQAWQVALAAVTMAYDADDFPRMGANFQPVESPELDGLSTDELVALPRAGYLGQFAVADARTMTDHTLAYVNLNEFGGSVGQSFRAIPQQAEPLVANLSLSNMGFNEFADSVAPDGIFRGF